ncbi:MAG: threonine--tRNA ligase [Gammaproteobacteria bacterium]
MIQITLTDGAIKEFEKPITGNDLAANIGKRLAQDAVAIKIDGQLRDLSEMLSHNCQVEIVTRQSDEGLEILRHDAAHVMAEAVKELFPDTQVTIGPAIDNGFYYDFSPKSPFSEEDLNKIESRMREIVDRDELIEREEWNRQDAIKFFKECGEAYKAEIIESIDENEILSVYRQGDFVDLCRGPHLPSTGKLGKSFKLMKIAGAYWRGSSENEMLQRIYGTAWDNDKNLKAYLDRLEEAEKRDHRKLGKILDLFHFQEEAIGSVFWHEKGWRLFTKLQDYMRKKQIEAGYQEVNTPELMDRKLWEQSGHWEAFSENMFTSETEDGRVHAIKPMNCPGHTQIFKQELRSYRDLPYRISEFGKVHRYEPSGALHGLMRVRAFTQDDAHIFCTLDQVSQETKTICDLLLNIYSDLGFSDVSIKFADRPEKRVGSDEIWDQAEQALKLASEKCNLEVIHNPGEGAFYGPKLEFVLTDAIGRDWQCGTIQVDLNLPHRLGATYIDEKGEKNVPVLIHRAIFGSLERFIGILIEHYEGKFPLWLSPEHIVIAPITSSQNDYAKEINQIFIANDVHSSVDDRNEKINYKIREHSLLKVPIIGIVGEKEQINNTITLRRLGSKEQLTIPVKDALQQIKKEITPPN